MNPALATVLSNPAIWRGGDCAPEPAALPSGYAELDAMLPGGGWPEAALTEIVLAREGIGELRLVLPAVARLQATGRDVVWIMPPYEPHAPALEAAGVDLGRLVIVQCRGTTDPLWAFEQALRAPECGAAFAWLGVRDDRALRRLAVAAREGRTWGVLWRRPGQHAVAPAAPLRLALSPQDGRLAVQVLKRRGGELARPALIDVTGRRAGVTDNRTSQESGNRPLANAGMTRLHRPSPAAVERSLVRTRDALGLPAAPLAPA